MIITGAGKGIGASLVRGFIERKDEFPGLKLFLSSRTHSDLEELSKLCQSAGIQCAYLAQDLAHDPAQLIRQCIQEFGKLNCLLHSAGVGRFGNFLDVTPDDVDFVVNTNIKATFLLLQSAYRHLKSVAITQPEGLRGQIQVITSVAADRPFEQSSIYCMSKYAQQGLLEVMRLYAHQDRIRITEVQPGATFTPMWGQVSDEMLQKMAGPESVATPMIDALLMPSNSTQELIRIRPIAGDI